MALVGDVIVRVREAGPDPSSFIGIPTFAFASAAGSIPNGTWYFVLTTINQWGESAPTAEQSIILTGGGVSALQINTVVLPPGGIGYRVYFGPSPGAEYGYIQTLGAGNTTISTLASLSPGVPPNHATGMNPDTNGSFVSSYTAFRWLNNALQKATKVAGGLPLLTGVQAIEGQGMYRIPGRWIHFVTGWFDGWPFQFGRKSDVFLRNTMSGITGIVSMEQGVDTSVIQLWPQPNRTGASTTANGLVAGPGPTQDQQIAVVNATGFLPLGLCKIDDEIIGYSGINSNLLTGIIRGLGGTLIVSHLSGVAVTELNLRLSGYVLPVDYAPGDSAKTLPIPPAWDEPLIDYLIAQFKKSELDNQAALGIEKQFEESIRKIAKESRPRTGPAQIGSVGLEVMPGAWGGGTLIPVLTGLFSLIYLLA